VNSRLEGSKLKARDQEKTEKGSGFWILGTRKEKPEGQQIT
jgi:hypothetical protein